MKEERKFGEMMRHGAVIGLVVAIVEDFEEIARVRLFIDRFRYKATKAAMVAFTKQVAIRYLGNALFKLDEHAHDPDCEQIALFSDDIFLATPADSPLDRNQEIDLADETANPSVLVERKMMLERLKKKKKR